MDESDFWYKVDKVIQATKCSKINAIEAVYTNYSVEDAIKKVKDSSYYIGGGQSGLAVQDNIKKIVLFRDGILAEDVFYSFNDRNNLRLQKMLEKGEFDAEILSGKPGDEVNVKFMSLKDVNYSKMIDTSNNTCKKVDTAANKPAFEIAKINCPDEFILDVDGDVFFKVFVGHKRVGVKMKKERKVSDLCAEIKKYSKTKFSLLKNNVKVDENETCEMLKNCLIILYCEV
ncbi:hypothetical protein BDAP_002116 [Binucleata daphniae]